MDSQAVDVVYFPWKSDPAKQLADGQSDSPSHINIRAETPSKKNGKIIKDVPSTCIYMEGSKETSKSSGKKGIGKKNGFVHRHTSRRQ